jgi:hypothetical protein
MRPAGALECFWALKTFTNEVTRVIAQGVLPIKYELERSEAGMTALGGLPLYLDLAAVIGLE